MSSVVELVTARAAALLVGATAAGSNVFRAREDAISRDVTPAIVVAVEAGPVRRMGNFTDVHEARLALKIFCRGDPWDATANGIDAAAHKALVGDATLLGYGGDLRRTDTLYESQEADRTSGVLTALYTLTYLAKAADVAANP